MNAAVGDGAWGFAQTQLAELFETEGGPVTVLASVQRRLGLQPTGVEWLTNCAASEAARCSLLPQDVIAVDCGYSR